MKKRLWKRWAKDLEGKVRDGTLLVDFIAKQREEKAHP